MDRGVAGGDRLGSRLGVTRERRRAGERAGAGLGPAHPAMDLQAFRELAAHGKDRVERGHRLLEDHADLVAADGAHQALVCLGKVDLAAGGRTTHNVKIYWNRGK